MTHILVINHEDKIVMNIEAKDFDNLPDVWEAVKDYVEAYEYYIAEENYSFINLSV